MALPLLTRASVDDGTFVHVVPRQRHAPPDGCDRSVDLSAITAACRRPPTSPACPSRAPSPASSTAFTSTWAQCIGCKCCVVACNEQNGNPAEINWRRVGEIEGGWYPNAQKSYVSMGCNHCVDPTCLDRVPGRRVLQGPATGIVLHSADTCIGCQYCTWNCSYGVPQFNPARGVVGKCDMCHGRLQPRSAARVRQRLPRGRHRNRDRQRSPTGRTALRRALSEARVMPVDDASLSTTRITMPDSLPPNARPLDLTNVKPDHPHWPLVVMTVLTQLSVGAFAAIWILQLAGAMEHLGIAALSSLAVSGLALGASTLHLGRPMHAYRAMKMWRRSWLSREVVLFGGFSNVAALYAGALWFGLPGSAWLGALTTLFGVAGVTATAYIYRVPSRPAWNTPLTLLQFAATGSLLGTLFASAVGAGDTRWLAGPRPAFAALADPARRVRLPAADRARTRSSCAARRACCRRASASTS